MRHAPNATVVVSTRGHESVPRHYYQNWRFRPVKTGERINIGESDLVFVEAPMCHWPDSMFTYLTGRNILMPNDAFGQHYATAFRFNDQVDQCELYYEALKYYANILTPYSKQVAKKIDEVLALNLPVSIIAPSHGVIWRQDPLQIVKAYQKWASGASEPSAVIIYDTMWNATQRMAEAIGAGVASTGVPYKLYRMAVSDRNDVLTEVFKAKAVLVGSPTLNNGLLPHIMPVLEEIQGLRFQNKIGAAFGSYGWSGESVQILEEHLQKSKIRIVAPGVKAKWQPSPDDLAACVQLGKAVAAEVRK